MTIAFRTQQTSFVETPRFQQIVAFYKAKIDAELAAHEPLPSERGVAEQFGVSRMTARRALEAIEAEGLAYSEGHTTFIENEHLELARFPGLLQHNLQPSTTQLLQAHYGVRAESSNIVIRLRALSADEAQVLGVKAQQAGVELEQTTYDASGKAICLSQQIWRGELAEYAATAVTAPD